MYNWKKCAFSGSEEYCSMKGLFGSKTFFAVTNNPSFLLQIVWLGDSAE